MARLNGTLTFVDKNGEDKSIVRVIEDLPEIKFGNHLSNDILIKSEDVEELHCKIIFNEIYRIIIKNYSTSHPILVNNQVVERSKELKSGDVITILENSMRWETKDDAKRRISCLSKEERKAMKRKYIKTNKRITIHSVSVQSLNITSPEEAGSSSSSSAEKVNIPENLPITPEESEEFNSPVKDQQAVPKDKENEKTPVKVNKLNMSGTLLTSYTPPALKLTRSVSKTPFSVPLRSPVVKSAAKNILNDSLNISKLDSPKSAQKLNTSQMHLIDLTTPFTKRTESSSTPKTSTIRKTPRTIGKTPLRNATLLKSAIKNSSIQKNVMQNVSNIAVKGKQLFESPTKSSNTPIKENTSSLIEISMSSVSEIDSSKGSINDNSNCEVQKVEENNGKTTNDEVKDLLESIDSVLDENKAASHPEEIISSSQELEDNFNNIVDDQRSSIGSVNESLFDKALNNVPIEDINNFDKLLTDEGTSCNDDTEKKGEIVLKLIEKARESLSTPNKTTQVLSARYSNITNESLTESANISQKYDATTPKISLLETVISGRKSDLTMGPVSRLSLTKDSTEIVENYQLNSNNSESLRSTRKRMRTAMSSIGILNASQSADTTFNESLNASNLNDKDQIDLNQSQTEEETNILSLDNQPDLNMSNKENEFSGSLNNVSMKFIEYSEFDENNQESKKIFELSNDGDDLIDSDIESDSEDLDEDLEDECLNEDIQDEPMDDDIIVENENNENTSVVESNNVSKNKCRISQADLDILGEEGIDILEQSKDEDQLDEMLKEAEADIQEKSVEPTENNGIEVLQETTKDSNGVNDFEEIPETQQIELDENIAADECPLDESEYLDDIPETQQMDFEEEVALDTNNTFDGTVEALDSTKGSEPSNEPQEDIQQEELPIENEEISDESVAVKAVNETNGNEQHKDTEEKIEQLDDTIVSELDNSQEESFNDHIEIPATQAFEFDESIIVEQLDETNEESVNIKEEASLAKFESSGSVFTLNDSIITSSQEPVNKSDTVESISIQEISDSSELCSQESNVARLGSSLNADDLISENESNEIAKETACTAQESKETIPSVTSSVSATINELIATPTDILAKIADIQQYSSSEIDSEHLEIPATQEMINDEETVVEEEEKTVEGDSAIGTTTSKIDQSNDSEEKRVDDSIAENPAPSRESALFSDTEFSHVEINASAFLKETDSEDFVENKNNPELTENETNKAQIDTLEEDKSEKQQELIKNELEKVDFDVKIVKNSRSILPSEIESSSGSRKTMIPEQIDDSFAAFINKKQIELRESEIFETDEIQEDIESKNENLEITSTVNEEKMNEIEAELARMNEEPIAVDIEKKRAASLMPTFEDGESSNKEASRMTIIPSVDKRRPSFLVLLEEEKSEMLQQKESSESVEEKLIVEDDNSAFNTNELSSDIQNDEEKEKEPVVEEPCIKKQAYLTTENESQVIAPETPSRRRVARVNYSELATGSPARSRRGRSASTESNKDDKEKEPKSAVKRKEKCVKMEPIVEDELSVQITVTATENVEEVAVPEIIKKESEIMPTEMTEKESEIMETEENVEKEISEPIEDEEMLPEDKIANDQDNDVTPEIINDNTQEKSDEIETYDKHPENLQLMEVPKPENLQLMEVPAPEKLQVMEVTKPERLQVVEVTKPSQEHPKVDNLEDISNNVDTQQKEDEILESVNEEVINDTENIETEVVSEEKQIDQMPELTSEDPEKDTESIEEVIEQIDDENIESTEKADSESVEEVTENVVETTEKHESVDNVQEEIVQKEEPEIVENVEEEVPSETHKEEIATKLENVAIEPQTPSRKRAKKLNYLELASGSPARTPRRGRTVSTEEKQEKSTKIDLPATISEEISDNTKDEQVVSSTNDELVTEEPKLEEKLPEVKKKPSRARKIEQLKGPETEDVPTPSKRLRRGVTPVQTQTPIVEPEKKSRKRPQKIVESEPEQSHEKELEATESEKQAEDVITISSTESIPKPVAKKGRGRQAKAVDEVPKEDEKVEEPQPVKKGRGRKAKIDEMPVVEEKSPEKVEASPKRGRGRKAAVEESHEEKTEVVETPIAKKSRKRQHDKPVEIEKPKDTDDINIDETVESPQPTKKQNRVQKATEEVVEHVQPEKATVAPKRGRKAKVEVVSEIEEPEKVEIAPKRAGRKGKIEEVVETHEEPAVQEAPKKGRGRKKVEETPKEPEIEHEKVEEPAQKRAGRKVAEQSVPETPTQQSVPKRAGRKGKLETIAAETHNDQVQETPKRGKKAKVDATPVIQEQPQPQHVEEIAPKKVGKKATKAEVVVESHEEPVVAQEAPKKGRGRKKADEVPKVEEPQTSNVQKEVIPVKKGRGRQAKVIETKTDEIEEVETEAPKRGRQLKHKVVETETNDQPVIKKPRGRQAKQEVNTKEPETQQIVESPKSVKTPIKKKAGSKHVTIITPSTQQAAAVAAAHHSKESTTKSEEPVVAKRATKRQAAHPVIEEEPVPAKRSTRVRK